MAIPYCKHHFKVREVREIRALIIAVVILIQGRNMIGEMIGR